MGEQPVSARRWCASTRCGRLRAIIAGRTTPPTDTEIAAHAEAHGTWIVTPEGWAPHYVATDHTARRFAEQAREPLMPSVTWRPLDAAGRLCAWPVVNDSDVVSDSARRGGD